MRAEFTGAVYHVLDRKDRREVIFYYSWGGLRSIEYSDACDEALLWLQAELT